MDVSLQTVMKILYIPNQKTNSTWMTWILMTKFQIEVNDHFKNESEFLLANKINSHAVMLQKTVHDTK